MREGYVQVSSELALRFIYLLANKSDDYNVTLNPVNQKAPKALELRLTDSSPESNHRLEVKVAKDKECTVLVVHELGDIPADAPSQEEFHCLPCTSVNQALLRIKTWRNLRAV